MTRGESRVGVPFNPSGSAVVAEIKVRAAKLIDLIDGLPDCGDGEIGRCKAKAMSDAEQASMWAVKAATKAGHATTCT